MTRAVYGGHCQEERVGFIMRYSSAFLCLLLLTQTLLFGRGELLIQGCWKRKDHNNQLGRQSSLWPQVGMTSV